MEARTVHEVVLADIEKHAGQALTDRKAMVPTDGGRKEICVEGALYSLGIICVGGVGLLLTQRRNSFKDHTEP